YATTKDVSNLSPIYPDPYDVQIWLKQGNAPKINMGHWDYDILYKVGWSALNNYTYNSAQQTLLPLGNNMCSASSENILPQDNNGYFDFNLEGGTGGPTFWGAIGFNPY